MRRIVLVVAMVCLVTGAIARGDDSAGKTPTAKAGVVFQQLTQKEAQAAALQNELHQLRREAGVVPQVLLKVRLMEIDLTLLQKSGLDFRVPTIDGAAADNLAKHNKEAEKLNAAFAGGVNANTSVLANGGVLPARHAFFRFLDALQKQGLAVELCAPNLVSESGRPASFRSGGEFPKFVGNGGENSGVIAPPANVAMKFYGTRVDFVPIALADRCVRVDVQLSLSTIDDAHSVGSGDFKIPALKLVEFHTAFESRLGETLVCAGATQEREVDSPPGANKDPKALATKHLFRQLVLVTPEAIERVAAGPRPPAK